MAHNLAETAIHDVEKAQKQSNSPLPPTPAETKTDVETETDPSPTPPKQGILVELVGEEDPRHWANWKKWLIIFIICTGATCGTCGSSIVRLSVDSLWPPTDPQ